MAELARRAGSAGAGLILAGLLASTSAWGATPADLQLEATVTDVTAVSMGENRALAVLGPDRTWIVAGDLSGVLSTWELGGHAIISDASGTLYTCGADGVHRTQLTPEGPSSELLLPGSCRDVALLAPKDGVLRIVVAGESLSVWSLPPDGAPVARTVGGALQGWPVLATQGKRFAAIELDGDALIEEGPWGTSALATGGPVGGLTAGPASWVWSLPSENALVDVTRRRIDVAPGPRALGTGDLDGDGQADLIVTHPDSEILGLIPGGSTEELQAPAPAGVLGVAIADLDADGCDEVVLATGAGLLRRLDRPCRADPELAAIPEEAPPAAPQVAEERKRLELGLTTPPALTVKVGERLDLKLVDVGGSATAFAASGGPSGLVVTSSGTVLYRARAEDVGTWRVQVRLWEDGSWARRASFEILVVNDGSTGPGEPRVSGTTSDLARALDEEVGALERNLPIHSCIFGVGGVLGGSRGRSWVTLGDGFLPSGSPMASIGCVGRARAGLDLWWYAGVDAAPFFKYLVDGSTYRHGIAATAALAYARDRVFAGGFVTAGATLVGFGPVVRWMPLDGPNGRRSGFETRMTWMPARQLIFEGTLMYTIQLGPARSLAPEPR